MSASTQSVRLDDKTRKRLAELGAARDRSPHWLIRQAIDLYLDREEQHEREKREDLERWERFELTGKSVPHEKVEKWLAERASGKRSKCPK